MDYVVARLAALDAEQVGVAAGVAPPSPQPPEARGAIGVLLQDLERAASSERAGNLQVLMPGMAEKDVAGRGGALPRLIPPHPPCDPGPRGAPRRPAPPPAR